ncbi:MAG: GTPase domain-containing protein [Bacteroidota bacterium]
MNMKWWELLQLFVNKYENPEMMIVRKTNNLRLSYLLLWVFVGCSPLSIKLGMDGDPSLGLREENTTPTIAFPRDTQVQALGYTPNGIIMGNVGCGKTALLNKLSGTSHATSGSGGSVTRELFREPVSYGNHPFRLVDTPGLSSDEEVYKHSFLLKSAYEAMPYNSIFVVLPYKNRNSLIKNEFSYLTRYVKKYQPNLVLMISHFDMVPEENRHAAERNVASLAERMGIRHTIMYGKYSNPTDLANAMYACMSNTPSIRINVTDEDFFLKFKICDPSELTKACDDFKKKSNKLLAEYSKKLQSIAEKVDEDLDLSNLVQAMGFSLSDELDRSIKDFEDQYGITMVEFDNYIAHVEMSKHKIKVVDKFLERIKRVIKWDTMDPSDIRNQIKQCPHCAQFLVKTEGCDGWTTCGNVPKAYDVVQNGKSTWYNSRVKRVDGELKIYKEEKQTFRPAKSANPQDICFVKSHLKPGAQLGVAGCGNRFEWGRTPFLSGNTLKYVIEELNSTTEQAVKNVAHAAQKKTKPKSNVEEMGITDENFSARREAYERQIDTTIKSDREGTTRIRNNMNDASSPSPTSFPVQMDRNSGLGEDNDNHSTTSSIGSLPSWFNV